MTNIPLFLISSPQLINIADAYRQSNRENLSQAFDFAHRQYGIMQLIDPEGKERETTIATKPSFVLPSRCGH